MFCVKVYFGSNAAAGFRFSLCYIYMFRPPLCGPTLTSSYLFILNLCLGERLVNLCTLAPAADLTHEDTKQGSVSCPRALMMNHQSPDWETESLCLSHPFMGEYCKQPDTIYDRSVHLCVSTWGFTYITDTYRSRHGGVEKEVIYLHLSGCQEAGKTPFWEKQPPSDCFH